MILVNQNEIKKNMKKSFYFVNKRNVKLSNKFIENKLLGKNFYTSLSNKIKDAIVNSVSPQKSPYTKENLFNVKKIFLKQKSIKEFLIDEKTKWFENSKESEINLIQTEKYVSEIKKTNQIASKYDGIIKDKNIFDKKIFLLNKTSSTKSLKNIEMKIEVEKENVIVQKKKEIIEILKITPNDWVKENKNDIILQNFYEEKEKNHELVNYKDDFGLNNDELKIIENEIYKNSLINSNEILLKNSLHPQSKKELFDNKKSINDLLEKDEHIKKVISEQNQFEYELYFNIKRELLQNHTFKSKIKEKFLSTLRETLDEVDLNEIQKEQCAEWIEQNHEIHFEKIFVPATFENINLNCELCNSIKSDIMKSSYNLVVNTSIVGNVEGSEIIDNII